MAYISPFIKGNHFFTNKMINKKGEIAMEKLMLSTPFSTIPVTFEKSRYIDQNNLYIRIVTWEEGYPEPWSDLTVNLGVKCEENTAYIDVNNNGPEILDFIIDNGLGVPTGKMLPSGFCVYPEVRFRETFMNEIPEI